MSRCANCEYAVYDQLKGYYGRWMCLHPHRVEISNKGQFTYPGCHNPKILICETAPETYGSELARKAALADANTPIWCYFDVVERAKKEQPGFDPDVQRKILWPGGY